MQRSTSVYGSSTAVQGVQLKIGEKFKPPARVTLPIGWKTRDPSWILGLTYDFSLEEQVIKKVAAEKEAKEQEANAQKAKELMNTQPQTPVIANMGGDILQPTTAISHGTEDQKKRNDTFNYKDFEGNADTPFELVELQSINNMDALKSVLQPELSADGVQSTQPTNGDPKPCNVQTNINEGHSAVSVNGNHDNLNTNIMETQPDVSTGSVCDTARSIPSSAVPNQVTYSHSLTNSSVNLFPSNGQNTKPVETNSSTGLNTRTDLNPFGPQVSTSSGSLLGPDTPSGRPLSNAVDIPVSLDDDAVTGLHTDRKVSMPGAIQVLPAAAPRLLTKQHRSVPNTFTDSVSPGINDRNVASSTGNQKRPIPKPRTKLPPLKDNAEAPQGDVPPPLPPKKTKHPPRGYEIEHKPEAKEGKHLQRYPSPLPPISPPPTVPDHLSSLSAEEIEFVNKVSLMGFPPPRVARAVKKLGCKEREVVEFLISVGDMCNLGYSENEVEMVLNDGNTDQKKAVEFLKLIAQFKELGFQEEQIFDALKKSECDRNKTLDILTCAS